MKIIRFLSFMSCYSSFISFNFFLSEFAFSLLHAYFCMILINVFLIPCNQTVHLITFHMSFYICWSVSLASIVTWKIAYEFLRELGIVSFGQICSIASRYCEDWRLENIQKMLIWVEISQKMETKNFLQSSADEAVQFQAHVCQTFTCFGFFSLSTWL